MRMGSLLFAYGMARVESLLPILNFVHLGFMLTLHTSIHVGSTSSAFGITCPESSLFLLNSAYTGSPLMPQTYLRADFSLLMYGMAHLGLATAALDLVSFASTPPLHSFA